MQEQNQKEARPAPNKDGGQSNAPKSIEMHITYDPKTGAIDKVQAPMDPILCMLVISDALEVLAKNFYEMAQKKATEEESLIVKPGLTPVDKRVLEEAQRLAKI